MLKTIDIEKIAKEATTADPRAFAADCVEAAAKFNEAMPKKIERDNERFKSLGSNNTVKIDMEDLKRSMQEQVRPEAYDVLAVADSKPVYETQLKAEPDQTSRVSIINDTDDIDAEIRARIDKETDR